MGVQPAGRNPGSGNDPLPGVGWEGVVDTLPDPVAIIDNQSRIVMVNRVLARRLGGDPGDFRGALCRELLHGPQYAPEDCPHQRTLADGREHRCERTLERLGGTFLIVSIPILDGNGRMAASLHLLKDISGDVEKEREYRQRETALEWHVAARTSELEKLNELLVEEIGRRRAVAEALQASEERYRKVVEDQTEVISRYLPDGTYTFVNETFCRFFGKSREELEGHPWMPDAYPEDLPMVLERLSALSPGNPVVTVENRVYAGSGEVRWMQFVNRGIFDGEGRLVETQGVGRDITDRKRMESSLRNLSRRLVEIDEDTRKKLAAEIHDEMGRDLTTLGLHWALMKEMLPEDSRRMLGSRLDDATLLLKNLTRTLRTMMVNLRPPVLDDYGLKVALTWYAEFFSEKSGVPISVLCADPFPRLTQECETALFRIAQEALTNAAKHAEAGMVTVTLGCEKGMLTLSVVDDGKGFSLAAPPKREGGGWGTTIMRERAMTIGGRFRMEAFPGEGCSVTVELEESACR
ncbi:PAS domain S-box protein [Geomonas sp. Red32]|uniref:PAS domain-containing sensor histidine kinase n=1 Tax=Geomonas sp. Red32 TaxID=2912856 RepID=UPI00202CDC02|nr:PAS domain S-box protein [Geomonas sp. Red32]MCM0084191.1 PAS domain S-box protein [Geomonas sp. Red32]